MKRVDGFVYHAKVKPTPHTPRKYLECPNRGRRLPASVGLKCPICGLRLRARRRTSSGSKTLHKIKVLNEIVALTYKPWCRKEGRRTSDGRLYLIERVPEIRERLSPIINHEVFRRAGRLMGRC
jgi:hypothetical protein